MRVLRMSAAEWVRDGHALARAGDAGAVELTTRLDVWAAQPVLLDSGDPDEFPPRRVAAGEWPVMVQGWGWDAAAGRWRKQGFKCWVPRELAVGEGSALLAHLWPGVRIVLREDPQPRRFLDEAPDDPCHTLPPGEPPPTEPGESPPWLAVNDAAPA